MGLWYGKAIARLTQNRPSRNRPHFIANHGQTLAHFPDRGITFQAGDPSYITAETGLTVAAEFRNADVAVGGQGAPLVPRYHEALSQRFFGPRANACIHNLGGISNITVLQNGKVRVAFDTGPGNLWIDEATYRATDGRLRMDRGGSLARKGKADSAAVSRILKHPYFRKKPPKSTGRDEFPFQLLTTQTRAKGSDLVATAQAVTVESIVRAYQQFKPSKIVFCGGGAYNDGLISTLEGKLPNWEISRTDDYNISAEFVEAQAFAFLGYLAWQGKEVSGPWTGRSRSTFGPRWVPGKNWRDLTARSAH